MFRLRRLRLRTLALRGGLLALGLAACSQPRSERVVLADLDLAHAVQDPVYGLRLPGPVGLHQFVPGQWGAHEGLARWALGDTAGIDLTLLGRDLRLSLRVATGPDLVAAGQSLGLLLDGRELLQTALPDHWQVDTLVVDLPGPFDDLRFHRLELVTDRQQEGAVPRAVFFYGLKVETTLDAETLDRWHEVTASRPSDEHELTIPAPADSDSTPAPADPDGPDLLIVLLDAARADHFSCYGYPRQTTPHVDALAAAGVRLEQVLAEAPYTRSSVPTLFTGRSWRRHGVIGPRDALPPEAITLAEILRGAGYTTLAISDNANVGRNAGSDQGFDEFVQTWTDAADRKPADGGWWHPELPVQLFEERLAQGLPADRPVFFYLHLMPPHEPYFPGQEFDRFGPQGYSGPVTGITPDIQAFDRGELAGDGADHARLVALYDGALARGDALVGRAWRAWAAMGRERPLLTVFLSDHGEGFGEHGRYGHNSTPFDEMLHVPVILHPAERVPVSLRNHPEGLRSLADLLPLLLSTLDVPLPAGSSWPARTLELLVDPGRPRHEIFVRCGPPLYGLRTEHSLTLLNTWSTSAYYDLRSDPSALHDLRGLGPSGWWTALGRLRGFLESSPSTSAAGARLDDADRERLRALGYL